ncbi:hypothetical protein NPIL_697251 [Nephila pilipes]|uniref:Uncharacterized protein n=1 Tax=Nephila pilipes TaxID=299642 RepID=A0A8X6UK77_NEPPI|nr:hypothetical protein NPIL_697251 [Nephila pilipes]
MRHFSRFSDREQMMGEEEVRRRVRCCFLCLRRRRITFPISRLSPPSSTAPKDERVDQVRSKGLAIDERGFPLKASSVPKGVALRVAPRPEMILGRLPLR